MDPSGVQRKVVEMIEPDQLGSHELLVEVAFSGINFYDLYIKKGLGSNTKLGLEASGVVLKVGHNVTEFQIGNQIVVYLPNGGCFANCIVVPESDALKLSKEVPLQDAAALSVNYVTAYIALHCVAKLKENMAVFIHGVAGGVGFAATQLCRLIPNTYVIGTTSEEKFDAAKDNGVNVTLNYSQSLSQEVRAVRPAGVDVVLDCMAGKDFNKSLDILAPLGMAIVLGAKNMLVEENFRTDDIGVFNLIMANRIVAGLNLVTLKTHDPNLFRQAWKSVIDLYMDGKIKPHIDSVFDLVQKEKALKRLEERQNVGKVVLKHAMGKVVNM